MNVQTGRIKITVMLALFGAAAFCAFAGDNDPYIESAGLNSVNVGYYVSAKTKIEVDFQLTKLVDGNLMVFGHCYNNVACYLWAQYNISDGTGTFSLMARDGVYVSPNQAPNVAIDLKRHKAVIDVPNKSMAIYAADGTVEVSGVPGSVTQKSNQPLILFGCTKQGDASGLGVQGVYARIYSVKISETENGEERLVHNLVPCRKGENVGFYDNETGAFFGGQGSGLLVAGGDGVVAVQEDGYIETPADNSTRGLSFNTGYRMTLNSRLEVDYQWLGTPIDLLFGAWDDGAKLSTGFWINGGAFSFLFNPVGGYRAINTSIDRDNYRHTAVIDVRNASFSLLNRSGFVQWSQTTSLGDNPQQEAAWPVVLFGAAQDADGNGKQFSYARIFSAKFYEGDDPNPVKAFVPYVKDGAAGFMETVSGEFTPTSGMSYGGAIRGRADAYVESDGTTCLNLGYKANMHSRIEMDFQSIDAKGNCLCGAWQSGSLRYTFWVTGSKKWSFIFHGKSMADPLYYPDSFSDEDENRHTVVMDMKNKQMSIVTDCVTNWTQVAASDTFNESDESSYPMGVFGNINNSAGTVANMTSKVRVYSVRIYEDDMLKHEFLPCKDGDTVSLYDTVFF